MENETFLQEVHEALEHVLALIGAHHGTNSQVTISTGYQVGEIKGLLDQANQQTTVLPLQVQPASAPGETVDPETNLEEAPAVREGALPDDELVEPVAAPSPEYGE